MSYKILIADDEEKIVQLICQLGHWADLDIEITAICTDGEQAFERIQDIQPDIVLTDIKMPVYDGIQLIEMTKALGLNTIFIVISGYKYFEYAKSAIQLGVMDYLLKPLEEGELNQTLERACRQADLFREALDQNYLLNQYVEKEIETGNKDLWHDLREQPKEFGEQNRTVSDCNLKYRTCFKEGKFTVAYITTNVDRLLTGKSSLFSEKSCACIQKVLGEDVYYLYQSDVQGQFLILNYDGHIRIQRMLSAIYYGIKNLTEIYGDFQINIGCSTGKDSIEMLPEALDEAIIAEWSRFVFMGDKILDYSACAHLSRFSMKDIVPVAEQEELIQSIKAFQFETMGKLFDRFYQRAAGYMNAHPEDMRVVFFSMFDVCLGAMEEMDDVPDKMSELLTEVTNVKSFQLLIKRLYIQIECLQHKRFEKIQEKYGRPVENAKRYLLHHLEQQISLEEAAKEAGLSASYFSKIFKSETGLGFAEWLICERIEKAKQLLIDGHLPIKEIARMVGYQDEKYFSKLFKKQVGIKPTDFKRLYG